MCVTCRVQNTQTFIIRIPGTLFFHHSVFLSFLQSVYILMLILFNFIVNFTSWKGNLKFFTLQVC